MEENLAYTRGATDETPSHAEYFSWINNTNEGATEEQTLINLAYFKWLHDTYGMQLDIYAWDAGNLDGARETYYATPMRKALIDKQFPRGYGPLAEAAGEFGARLGVWCGPDGFGTTPEEAAARHEKMVSLCRDFHFALFKIDGVCGQLRPEKVPEFISMMRDCRRYSPDLVLLNHRLPLGDGEKWATTFLWQGAETYADILITNGRTAPHHRAFIFGRGNVPGLRRLSEDHGTCLSSWLDNFDDDLVFQAFGRDLILAPEIYANPWLLRDDEQAKLAHLFNLHKRLNPILVHGELLPEDEYGPNAVVRGDEKTRVIVCGNPSWKEKTVRIKLDESIGLAPCDRVTVISHHPYEEVIGGFAFGETATVKVGAFRAGLYEICDATAAPDMPRGIAYLVVHEDGQGRPDKIRVVKDAEKDLRTPPLRFLGSARKTALPDSARTTALLESTLFAASSDTLERQSLARSGPTAIPAVKAARDAFFGQRIYTLRGSDSDFAFDGNEKTIYDASSHAGLHRNGRVRGGCLRVDFGDVYDADAVEFEYFAVNEPSPMNEILPQLHPDHVDVSTDLALWNESGAPETGILREDEQIEVVRERVHDIRIVDGKRMVTRFSLNAPVRYLRMPDALDRIYRISLMKNGKRLPLRAPRANTMLPVGDAVRPIAARALDITVDATEIRPGAYLSVAFEGVHGLEGAYAMLETPAGPVGAPERATSYPCNPWEGGVASVDAYYTYYIPLTPDMAGKPLRVWALFCDADHSDTPVDCYLCYRDQAPTSPETTY